MKPFLESRAEGEVVLFQDESSFYQSGIPSRCWTQKGTTPTLPIHGSYTRLNVFGAVNPFTGESFFQYISRLNADCFLSFLRGILNVYPDASKIYVVIDNAPGHRANKVREFVARQPRLVLIRLPPYSPDLNPIETVWREVKRDVVYNTFYATRGDFEEALTRGLQGFAPERVKRICSLKRFGVEAV